MVSIITPCYNGSRFIGQTINSVFQQTYQDWQLIIIDDCSTDDSLEVIYSYSVNNPKVKVISLKKNVGAAMARNIALKAAQGRYISFLDGDDIWVPEKLERQVNFMFSNNYAFTFSAYRLMEENGKLENRIIKVPPVLSYTDYLKNTIIGCLTVIIDKEQVGEFEMPNLRSSHDMALWLQILKKGYKAYGLNEVLAYYRLVGNSNTVKKRKAARDVWRVYRKIERLSIAYSVYCFLFYAFNAVKKRML